ncbi:carbohydrate-binding module family 50 protein [Periconia macrospinosa]|uniref:Carbohydrate-binding module family 50 protein n=1 Tax=Periconia macrospinosa TaxID=97972 RepID=A0A2V1E504_9PLEO|nr:carbohydrate-binding module family 50 protein [Periconia macrospinosa]
MNPTNGSPSFKSSSSAATSTLRPRTRRLISVEDELNPASASGHTSPAASRSASPIPSTHPSRSNVTSAPTSSFARSPSLGTQLSQASHDSSNMLYGLWGNSWSAIQGLATNVLGSETGAGTTTSNRRRKPLLASHRRTSSSAPPKQWGPPASASSQVGAGTQEERESMVRAMKRRDLLIANEHLVPDSVGRIKRRNSDERLSSSAPPGDNDDRDALIFIHHVKPQDTLAGITIKYGCQQAVLRKANRMWPNDTVQTKKTIVIPVDACDVKGRPVAGPDARDDDLLIGDWSEDANATAIQSSGLPNGWVSSNPKDQETTSVHSSSLSNSETEKPWKHDSWVLLPNSKEPTEIGRMPRRALGFFPPARRKSLTFSDAASTPRASLDLTRSSTNTSSQSQFASPSQNSRRPRASSILSNVSSAHSRQRSTSGFQLHGPGGVGTMGKNVRSPGPAQDGLNKLFAQHLPNVEPPPGQEYFTPWAPGLLDAESGISNQYGGSGAHTPLSGGDINFQEIGGAIEGWMRKVGSQASKLLSEPSTPGQGKRSAVPVIGAVGGDLGDLIELRDDAFEVGDGEEDRGRKGNDSTIPSSEQYQSARPDINLVLRPRGKGGASKND